MTPQGHFRKAEESLEASSRRPQAESPFFLIQLAHAHHGLALSLLAHPELGGPQDAPTPQDTPPSEPLLRIVDCATGHISARVVGPLGEVWLGAQNSVRIFWHGQGGWGWAVEAPDDQEVRVRGLRIPGASELLDEDILTVNGFNYLLNIS